MFYISQKKAEFTLDVYKCQVTYHLGFSFVTNHHVQLISLVKYLLSPCPTKLTISNSIFLSASKFLNGTMFPNIYPKNLPLTRQSQWVLPLRLICQYLSFEFNLQCWQFVHPTPNFLHKNPLPNRALKYLRDKTHSTSSILFFS